MLFYFFSPILFLQAPARAECERKGKLLMICPIMSANKIQSDLKDFIPCINSCALYVNGDCALTVLAQKAIFDAKKDKKKTSESPEQSSVE